MKDGSDDPLHHKRMLLPRSYISLPIVNEYKRFKVLSYNSYTPPYNTMCVKINPQLLVLKYSFISYSAC